MDDLTIRLLLSRFINQLLNKTNEFNLKTFIQGESEPIEQRELFAEELALASWNSLIYLLRQSFVKANRVDLAEVGEFVKQESDGSWSFFPAASLAQADAAGLPSSQEGSGYMAKLALFHLNQGIEMAKLVNADVEVPKQDYVELFGEYLPEHYVPRKLFSQELLLIAEWLKEFSSRIEPEASSVAIEENTQNSWVLSEERKTQGNWVLSDEESGLARKVTDENKPGSYKTREGRSK